MFLLRIVSLKPELFEGMRFDFTKGLNQKFSLSHRSFWDSLMHLLYSHEVLLSFELIVLMNKIVYIAQNQCVHGSYWGSFPIYGNHQSSYCSLRVRSQLYRPKGIKTLDLSFHFPGVVKGFEWISLLWFIVVQLMLFGRVMTDGRLNARLKCDLTDNLAMKANAQVSETYFRASECKLSFV